MAATLTSLSARVSQTLVDTGNTIWAAAAVAEGIRSALGEYNLAAAVDNAAAGAVTLAGLDGAAVTSLPEVHDMVILWGAAGYCAQAQAIERADSPQLGTDAGALQTWADARLREFKAMLGALFPVYLAAAFGSPAGAASDPARTAAEIALMAAQAGLASSEAARVDGVESREAAAAAAATQDRLDEAARRADLRSAASAAWGSWADDGVTGYAGDKPE